jgi:predicted nuclease with TOPRIM domain
MNSSSEGMFVSAEEINNMNFLSGKQLADGSEEFSKTKQWTKSMKDIEEEQKNKQEILSQIIKLEDKIDIVLKKIELLETNAANMSQNNKKQTETLSTPNSSWKDKFKW